MIHPTDFVLYFIGFATNQRTSDVVESNLSSNESSRVTGPFRQSRVRVI